MQVLPTIVLNIFIKITTSDDAIPLLSEEELEKVEPKKRLLLARWPKVLGLEQIFQDMEISEETTFLEIQGTRDWTYESLESDSPGNNKALLILQISLN